MSLKNQSNDSSHSQYICSKTLSSFPISNSSSKADPSSVEPLVLASNSNFKVLGTSRRHCIQKVEGKRHFAANKINLLGVKYIDIIDLIHKKYINKEDVVGEIDWILIGKE